MRQCITNLNVLHVHWLTFFPADLFGFCMSLTSHKVMWTWAVFTLYIYIPDAVLCQWNNTYTHTSTWENLPQHVMIYPPRNVFKWVALICSVERSSIEGYLNGSQLPFNRPLSDCLSNLASLAGIGMLHLLMSQTHALISLPSRNSLKLSIACVLVVRVIWKTSRSGLNFV